MFGMSLEKFGKVWKKFGKSLARPVGLSKVWKKFGMSLGKFGNSLEKVLPGPLV